jgi:hypothetical protein
LIDAYERMLGHLDGIFSVCRIKRYHVQAHHLVSAKAHRDNVLAFWRYVGLSVTPKMHCLEDHVVPYMEKYGGFGDMGEDEGERGHQVGHGNEDRSRNLRNHTAKASAHAEWEAMVKNEDVRARVLSVAEKAKRVMKKRDGEETYVQRNKRMRDVGRLNLLELPTVSDRMETLKDMRKKSILEELGEQRDHSKWNITNIWSKDKDVWVYPVLKK